MIRPADLDCDSRSRLRRSTASDLDTVLKILAPANDEDRLTNAFRTWLISEGWTSVTPTDRWTDIEAVRDGQRLIGEVSETSDPGTDTDTGYGQLLRRMTSESDDIQYALVVPATAVPAAERVPSYVRDQLRIHPLRDHCRRGCPADPMNVTRHH